MKLRAVVIALGVLVALSACAAPATAPTPTATAADESAAAVVVDVDGVDVTTASGVSLGSFDYFADAGVAVGILTEAFGAEPVVDQVAGLDSPGYTRYDWTGFQLQALGEGADRYPPLRVSVLVTDVGDLRIATTDGISVGQDADALATANPGTQTFGGTYSMHLSDTTLTGPDGTTFSVYVGVAGQVGGQIITITSPQVNDDF